MKKIITMVGTSLFENYILENDDNTVKNYYEDLKDKSLEEYNKCESKIRMLKNKISEWLKKNKYNVDISAEIKSLTKLKQELKDDLGVYFLTSDTVLSKVASEIITENWKNFEELKDYNFFIKEIKNLQVKDKRLFNDGMVNLINAIYKIAKGYWGNVIINISAGYKATLPFLTILAQVNKCPIYYIFENTDALINIPFVPLSINWQVFKENEHFLYYLEVNTVHKLPDGIELRSEVESLVEKSDNLVSLNPLGIAFWEKYKESFDLFYISYIAIKYFENRKDRQTVIKKSFQELKRRLKENPLDPDLKHFINDFNPPNGFYTFKHKEDNLQVRILYKVDDYKTRYGSCEKKIYIGLIAVGNDVHNVESEYVEFWRQNAQKICNTDSYLTFRIEKGNKS